MGGKDIPDVGVVLKVDVDGSLVFVVDGKVVVGVDSVVVVCNIEVVVVVDVETIDGGGVVVIVVTGIGANVDAVVVIEWVVVVLC